LPRWHLSLVIETWLDVLKRRSKVEDLSPALNCDHSPCGEASAVSSSVDLKKDWNVRVARMDKVAVQRMAHAIFDSLIRS